jgi:hypothetical protein
MVSDHLQFLATLLPTENCCWVEYSLGNTACLNTVEDKRVLLYRLSNPTFQPAVSHCALILSHTERGESKCCLFQYSAVWTEMWATSNFHYSNFWDISVTASWSDFVAVHRGGENGEDDDDDDGDDYDHTNNDDGYGGGNDDNVYDDNYLYLTLWPLKIYISRTAQLTSRHCILNIYSTNILTEYFKHAAHSPFFSLQDAVYFIMLSFLVPVIFTF